MQLSCNFFLLSQYIFTVKNYSLILSTFNVSLLNVHHELYLLRSVSLERIKKNTSFNQIFLGHTINRLTKHEDKDVANLASSIVNDWKAYYAAKRDRPKIEVKCDNKTEAQRAAGRKLLQESLDGQVGSLFYYAYIGYVNDENVRFSRKFV